MRSWRRNPESGLEAELRSNRPEPSASSSTGSRCVSGRTARRRAGSFRVAFAGALAVGVLAALASVGGLGYAATGAGQAVQSGEARHARARREDAPQVGRADQYRKPKAKKCRKGTKRVKGKCKRVKKARGVRFRKPPFTG